LQSKGVTVAVKNRKYTVEFKRDAVELARQLGNASQAARQLGIVDSLLHVWIRKFGSEPQGNSPERTAATDAEEIARLRKENLELKKVNQILKAAAAFFSQDHLK
jgi:transposase